MQYLTEEEAYAAAEAKRREEVLAAIDERYRRRQIRALRQYLEVDADNTTHAIRAFLRSEWRGFCRYKYLTAHPDPRAITAYLTIMRRHKECTS